MLPQALAIQWQYIRLAVMFYTRIPVGTIQNYDQDVLNRTSRYFTLVGALVGALCALVFWLCSQYFPQGLAAVLSTAFGVWLTGAFHEDGLADACDGLGGGWDKAKILEIMKDSRIGTYGFAGLALTLSLKCMALSALPMAWVVAALLAGHVASRWCASLTMWCLNYVRLDENSKTKPITKEFENKDFAVSSCIALVFIMVCLPMWALPALLGMLPFGLYLAFKLHQWLGGYTGDGLGAMQQVTEVGFYLGLLAVVN
jgi:adenosylcobinamide-GDP ribazoletransferase